MINRLFPIKRPPSEYNRAKRCFNFSDWTRSLKQFHLSEGTCLSDKEEILLFYFTTTQNLEFYSYLATIFFIIIPEFCFLCWMFQNVSEMFQKWYKNEVPLICGLTHPKKLPLDEKTIEFLKNFLTHEILNPIYGLNYPQPEKIHIFAQVW